MRSFKYQYLKLKLEENFYNNLVDIINESQAADGEGKIKEELSLIKGKVMNGDTDARSCYLSFIDNQKLYKLLYPLVQLANSKLEWDFNVDYLEPVQYTVYNPGDFYDWHLDEGSWVRNSRDNNRIRKISYSIVLPSEFEGGDFILDTRSVPKESESEHVKNLELGPRSCVFFASDTPHTVLPVTSGVRKSLVGWAQGPAFK